jgi:hypothetical protein
VANDSAKIGNPRHYSNANRRAAQAFDASSAAFDAKQRVTEIRDATERVERTASELTSPTSVTGERRLRERPPVLSHEFDDACSALVESTRPADAHAVRQVERRGRAEVRRVAILRHEPHDRAGRAT